MRRSTILIVMAAALALGGCKSFAFDPMDKLQDLDIMGSGKKPLQGDRHAVFPEGVPGVAQGVPPDLVKGYQAPVEAPPPVVVEKKVKPKPKRVAARPKPKKAPPQQAAQPQPGAPAQQQTTAWPEPPQQQGSAAAWPAPPQQQQPAQAAWPAPATIPGSQPTWPTQAAPPPAR